jgi:hypothetical protein
MSSALINWRFNGRITNKQRARGCSTALAAPTTKPSAPGAGASVAEGSVAARAVPVIFPTTPVVVTAVITAIIVTRSVVVTTAAATVTMPAAACRAALTAAAAPAVVPVTLAATAAPVIRLASTAAAVAMRGWLLLLRRVCARAFRL